MMLTGGPAETGGPEQLGYEQLPGPGITVLAVR
jgi:hypothetical protein